MRYRDLLRKTASDLKDCAKSGAPEWLVGYAEASMDKANYHHARRRSAACAARSNAVNELLHLSDVLRYWMRHH